MRVRNLDTKGNTLAAAFTFSHGTCTSCSEVRNQNNQLDYCSRLPGKMQAFFQKILRFLENQTPSVIAARCQLFPFWHFVPPPPAGGVCLKEGASGEEDKPSVLPKAPSQRGLSAKQTGGVHLRKMLQCVLPLAQKRQMRYTINTTTAPVFR